MTLPTATGTTADRLQAYYQAELSALQALRSQRGDRSRQMAELAQIREGINQLKAQAAAETVAARGRLGPPTMVSSFNPRFCGRPEGGSW